MHRISCRLLAGLLALGVAEQVGATIISQIFFNPEEVVWGLPFDPVGTNPASGWSNNHPHKLIDFDGDGIPELEILGRGPRSVNPAIRINTFEHTQVMAADQFSLSPGGIVLPVPKNISIGDDAASYLYGGLPDVGWHHHWDFGYIPSNPFIGEEDYYPALLLSSGGLWGGNVGVGGYFGLLGGTPPFDGVLYIGVRFGEDGAWNYSWLQINIWGGWEGFISGWAYETELNKSILAGAIPEPASSATLLALVALGTVVARRRRR